MNFSSPRLEATTCTFASLIQETTVCPPSRGLFFCLIKCSWRRLTILIHHSGFDLTYPHIPSITRDAMTTAGQSMALQYDRNAVHTPARMPFDEGKLAQMQRTLGLI